MTLSKIRLKKGENRRVRVGHPWIFSNEIDVTKTPLKDFNPGQEIIVEDSNQQFLGVGYINPHSLIAIRLFSRHLHERLNEDFILQKLNKATFCRETLFDKPYYRLIFSEADDLPGLIVDRFNNDFVLQINTAGMERVTETILNMILKKFPETNSILLKNDSKIREQEALPLTVKPGYGNPPDEAIVYENHAKYKFPLARGQKTGWFYDHRMNRGRLNHYVKNQKVLDVFSYLGAFAVEAAVSGAKQVDCIESSVFAADYIKVNAKLNGMDQKIKVICEDAFSAMKRLLSENKKYNVIILDPPAFVKKTKDRKEGLIAYQRINELAIRLLSNNGFLITCSCSMHIGFTDLMKVMQRVAYRTQTELQIVERGYQGPDHPLHIAIPETDYLKAIFLRKM